MIKKRGDKFVVTNKAGTKVLGTHGSKEKAQKQLAAIEISKAKHMHENKSFKAFRSTLNESEYSEVLTGYGNRSAHKDDAGLHHLQSAGALAGINAMLATIGKGTYLDPNEAFLKMKVRLNVVQLDFAWKPGSWDGGVGSYDIPVVQFGRVDGYDAQTGQIRFDGKANPTGGYTELNLHVDVELTPESLYVVTAKLTPSVAVAEEVEVAEEWKSLKKTKADLNALRASGKRVSVQHGEGDTLYRVSKPKKPKSAVKEEAEVTEDYQTPAREKEMARKIAKHDEKADRAYTTVYTSPSHKKAKAAEKRLNKHAKEVERLTDRDAKEWHSSRTYGRGGKLVKRGSRREVKEEIEQIDEVSPPGMEHMTGSKHTKASFAKQYGKRGKEVMYATAWKQYNKKKKEVKEEAEQIDEAGQAKLERLGKAYDKARIGSRGVLNPERKKELGDAYFKMRDTVLDKRKKRIAAGTFDKEKELQQRVAINKKKFGNGAVKEETNKPWWEGKTRAELDAAAQSASDARKGEEAEKRKRHAAHNKGKRFFNGTKWIKEELVGGQKKLDVNKNKRLDSQDFALLRAKKKSVSESKIKQWTPRLDKLFKNRDKVYSKPKKTILTQKVKDGKKIGSPRPIPRYEGK